MHRPVADHPQRPKKTEGAFPWAELEEVRPDQQRLLEALARLAQRFETAIASAGVLAFDAPGRLAVQSVCLGPEARAADSRLGLLICASSERKLQQCVLIEAEPAVWLRALSAALRRPGVDLFDGQPVAAARLLGALCALTTTWLRMAGARGHLQVLAAGPAHALYSDLRRASGASYCAAIDLDVQGQSARFDVSAPARVLHALGRARRAVGISAARDQSAVAARLLVRLTLVSSWAWAQAAELAALGIGDVWLPGNLPGNLSACEPRDGDHLSICAARSEAALCCKVTAAGARIQLTVVKGERLPWNADPQDASASAASSASALQGPHGNDAEMVPKDQDLEASDALLALLNDVPVAVRVEVGSVTMSASAWANLTVGDVLETGIQLGSPVTLRAGGAVLASGELVRVGDEIGVRIVKLVPAAERNEPETRMGAAAHEHDTAHRTREI
jgi:type III secretion system YscQ/HrcQ family protein